MALNSFAISAPTIQAGLDWLSLIRAADMPPGDRGADEAATGVGVSVSGGLAVSEGALWHEATGSCPYPSGATAHSPRSRTAVSGCTGSCYRSANSQPPRYCLRCLAAGRTTRETRARPRYSAGLTNLKTRDGLTLTTVSWRPSSPATSRPSRSPASRAGLSPHLRPSTGSARNGCGPLRQRN